MFAYNVKFLRLYFKSFSNLHFFVWMTRPDKNGEKLFGDKDLKLYFCLKCLSFLFIKKMSEFLVGDCFCCCHRLSSQACVSGGHWRKYLLDGAIKHMRAHFNSQFCFRFLSVFSEEFLNSQKSVCSYLCHK